MYWTQFIFILFLLTIPEKTLTRRCSRYPSNTLTPKSPVDENFAISITGNVHTYILGQSYNVSLHAYNEHRFISAKLVLENESGDKNYKEDLGRLKVIDPVETRYSQQCINMIESTNTNPKTRLNIVWTAPSEPGNGCVLIRATVLQHRDVWFMDDGGLTKRVCEEVVDDIESQKKDLEEIPCCACDEARYELTFEGLWSRNLHPKGFPTRGWLTRFTDIMGAAHTSDYRFWDKGVLASPEMQELAEHGSSKSLEREFNHYFKEGKIRTIIKARGPAFPSINSPSIASVRVDPLHHQISIVSKIIPSPDWIVGVPGLELCLANCTWLEEKVINLYPWDVGTDAGPSYTSPDQPQFPPDVIRRMSSEYPPDPRSPFFDETGAPMKPLATLTIKRHRIYERKCENEESNNMENLPRECFTHPWTSWSECTVECGEGKQYRTRVYKQPDVAKVYNCDDMVRTRQERPCQGEKCLGIQAGYDFSNAKPNQWPDVTDEGKEFNSEYLQSPLKASKSKAECLVGVWSPWSVCNVTCGEGMMERRREYVNPYNERECQDAYFLKLRDYKKCQGKNCLGHIKNPLDINNDFTDDTSEFEIKSPTFNTDFKPQYTPYENAKNLPSYSARKHLSTELYGNPIRAEQHMAYAGHSLDLSYNAKEKTQNEMESERPQYNFQAEDLRQEPTDGDLQYLSPKMYPNIKSTDLMNIPTIFQNKQAHQKHATYSQQSLKLPPAYCYQPLHIVHGCIDQRVVGNFWFYNYCTDECMLYATDICDDNNNKFLSLEQCEEHCAWPMRKFGQFLKQKQNQECREAILKKRRNNVIV